MVIGLCVARFFLVNIMTREHFFGKKNFFHFYVVILKYTMKGFMINLYKIKLVKCIKYT